MTGHKSAARRGKEGGFDLKVCDHAPSDDQSGTVSREGPKSPKKRLVRDSICHRVQRNCVRGRSQLESTSALRARTHRLFGRRRCGVRPTLLSA
jgi:hypothetical protein